MERRRFVARMPDEPGSLHRAAELLKRQRGNVERIQYDRRIDPSTVFFEVLIDDRGYEEAMRGLEAMGYLQQSLEEPAYLLLEVQLPHERGTLFELLDSITDAHSNISSLDFDATGGSPDSLRLGLVLDDHRRAEGLLEAIKSRYPMRVLEHRRSGEGLDDAVFYLRFAQEMRSLAPGVDDGFLLRFLSDTNHIMQLLRRRGQDHRRVFEAILESGRRVQSSSGPGFFCDIQTLRLPEGTLHAIQPPCGGNVYLLEGEEGCLMVDCGYGSYHGDLMLCLASLGISPGDVEAMLLTHADGDHAGSAGLLPCPTFLSRGSLLAIEAGDRAHGTPLQGAMLEAYYTRMINLVTGFSPPVRTREFGPSTGGSRGAFEVLERLSLGGWEVEVLKGMDGHAPGQVFFHLPRSGALFSSDSLLDFASISEGRKEYMDLARLLIISVNIDSARATEERTGLRDLASGGLLVCPGHGPAFRLLGGEGVVEGEVRTYRHGGGTSPADAPGR